MNYRVLGISSGIGVSLYPFKDRLIGNIEPRAIFHTPKEEQWKANFGDIPLLRYDLADFRDRVNVVISSPDCGSGSILRYSRAKKLGTIKKNQSLELFFKGIKQYKPDFFYFENLPAMFKSMSLRQFNKKLKNRYRLVVHEASVTMWGNSQLFRKRLVIIGIKNELPLETDGLFKLPDYRDRMKTCRDLYGDLDKVTATPYADQYIQIADVRESSGDAITMYSKFKCRIGEARDYWQNNPKAKRWAVENRNFQNAPGVYRNRANDYPNTARKANRQFDHHGFMLSPRQLARIQGVPDDFKIHVVRGDKLNYWINKGRAAITKTPPMEISKWFFNKLNKFYATK